jgi:REP element-mobilizing transposase RayT
MMLDSPPADVQIREMDRVSRRGHAVSDEPAIRGRAAGTRRLQQALVFRTWCGARPGAGRKRRSPRPRVPHTRRPDVDGRTPVHLTLRLREDVPCLRRRHLFRVIRQAIARTAARPRLRLTQFTVQGNHLHLYGEPAHRDALSRGLQGTVSLIARRINRALGRRGKVFDDRYHARYLRTPAEVRAALCYLLNNWRRHREDRRAPGALVDWYSTGALFDGWSGARPRPPPWLAPGEPLPVAPARMWLSTVGWRRHGLIGPFEVPGTRAPGRASRRAGAS